MANIIANVASLEGKFFTKDLDGNIHELKEGDSITKGMLVFGDANNLDSAQIAITPTDGSKDILLMANQEQAFDDSLSEDINYEDALFSDSVNDVLSEARAFDETLYSDEDVSDQEENTEEEETEAGDEKKKQDEGSADFAARDGNLVDVNSDLRDAKFKFTSHTYEIEDRFESEATDRLTSIPSEPNNPTPPPTPPTPPTIKPPVTVLTVTPEIVINDVTMDEENGFMIFTVTASSVAGSEISFTYETSDGTAKDGTDYTAVSGTGVIKAGEDSTTIKVPIVDDFYAEDTEQFFLNLSDISPNATLSDDQGKGTILDNGIPDGSEPSEPNNPDSPDEVNGFDGEDTVFVKLTDNSSVNEGGDLVHGIKLVDANGADVLLLDGQSVTVTLAYTPDATNGADETDFTAQTTVTITGSATGNGSAIITNPTLDDIFAEDIEGYTLSIDTISDNGNSFENILNEGSTVTGTIGDDALIKTLGETTKVILIALDSNGDAILDTEGNYTFANDVNEDSAAFYKAVAFSSTTTVFNASTQLDAQLGSVVVSSVDTGSAAAGSDYTHQTQSIELNTPFSIDTLDDFISDSGETLNVVIDSYVEPTSGVTYENVTIDGTVTTTIVDNSQNTPDSPYDETTTPPVEIDLDTITIKLFAISEVDGSRVVANEVTEGNSAEYIAVAFDKDGNEVLTNETVEVTFEKAGDTATFNGVDYTSTTQTVTLGTKFSTPTTDDYMSDNDETFKIQITDETLSNAKDYETVIIDTTVVTTTIKDNTNPNTPETDDGVEGSVDKVIIKLVALDVNGDAILDGSGNYTFANDVNEGDAANYMALAFEPGETVFSPSTKIADQVGTIDVTFNNGSATGASSQTAKDGSQDYDSDAQATITLGTTISTATFDDYMSDDGETFTIAIDAGSYTRPTATTGYEDVAIDTTVVTTTIKDNTNPNTPETDDGVEGSVDKVIIKLVALDVNGDAILDGSGNYTFANDVNEGDAANYMALAFEPGETVFSPSTKIADQVGTIDVTFNNGSATGVSTFTPAYDGSEDYDSDAQAAVTLGTVISTDTFDDFFSDDGETFTIAIDAGSYTRPTATTGYEDVAIDTTVVTTTIKDDISFGTTDDAYVDESNFIAGGSNSLTGTIFDNGGTADPDGGSSSGAATFLGLVTDATYNDYTIALDSSIAPVLTSAGTNILYDYSADGLTLVGYLDGGNSTDDKVFEVVLDKQGNGGADDTYTYTQFQNLDHPDTDDGGDGDTDDDTISFDFGFTITNDATTSPTQNFTIVVNDSLPTAGTITSTMSEDALLGDAGTLIWISNENFSGGDIILGDGTTDTLYASGDVNSVDSTGKVVSDGTDVGTITNNGDGSITFIPNSNYSGTPTVQYTVSDDDGDSATGTIDLTVTAVADAPTMQADKVVSTYEDASWDGSAHNGDKVNEVALGLTLPVITDSVDQTAGAEDAPERLSALTFTFASDVDFDGAVMKYDSDANGTLDSTLQIVNRGDSFTVMISDITDYHPNGTSANYSLTQAEYESLAVVPVEDNANDVVFTIKTESHEVTDAGDLYSPDIVSLTQTQNVEVDILAVTDPVTLREDTTSSSYDGTDDQIINIAIDEDTTLDLADLLVQTFGDADGSEKHRFDVSGVPEGTTIIINGTTRIADADGEISSVSFTTTDTTFTIKPPLDWDGDMDGVTLKLISTDSDGDSVGINQNERDTVTLNLHIKPTADDISVLTPNSGDEDTAIALFLDASGNTVFNITDTVGDSQDVVSGVKILTSTITGTIAGASTTDDGTYTIFDVSQLANYTITPPSHSSTDMTMTLVVETTDDNGVDAASVVEHSAITDYTIEVSPVAESVTLDSNTLDGGDGDDVTINPDHLYTATALEDGNNGAGVWFELGTEFTSEDGSAMETYWSNEDDTDFTTNAGTQYDSEDTYATLTLMTDTSAGFNSTGETAVTDGQIRYSTDGGTTWITSSTENSIDVPVEYLDTIEFMGGDQFSGDLKIKIEAKTVDSDEDSSATDTVTSGEAYLRFTVDPVADDATIAIKQAFGDEDSGRLADGTTTVASAANGIDLDVTVTSADSVESGGSETYTLTLSDIPDGAEIYYDGNLITASSGSVNADITATDDGGANWHLEIKDFSNSADFKYIPVLNSNDDVTLNATAHTVDGADTGADTTLAVNVKVTGVADTPTYDATKSVTIDDTDGVTHTYNAIVVEDTAQVTLETLFTADTPNFSSFDIDGSDGSETLYVLITGVDVGFDISGASSLGGSGESREWLVEASDFANVKLDIPTNYSGEVNFNLKLQTVEDDDDKSTIVDIPLSVLITPEAEGSVNSSATQDEDTSKVLSFAFSDDGDANQNLETLWIDTETIEAGVELVTGTSGQTLTQTSNGSATWVEITVTNGVAESVTANILTSKHDNDDDYTFDFRYSMSDSADDGTLYKDTEVAGNTYNDTTVDYITDTYSVTLNAVTDTATLTLGTITDSDGDADSDLSYDSGSQTVTVTDNTIFNVPLTLTSDDMASESSNGQDLDTSEHIVTTVDISGVPDGIEVVGGTYLGDVDDGSGGSLNSGRWRVDISNDLIIDSNSGELNNIEFEVGRASYPDINATITMTVSHQDGGATVLENSQSFDLVIDGSNFGGTQTTTDEPMDINVTQNAVTFIEDTGTTLDNFLTVSDDTSSSNDSSDYAITITNLSGATVSGMSLVDGSFYTLTGSGDVNAIIASLQSITLTADTDENINTPSDVLFDVTITTYGTETHNTYPFDNVASEIAPVTDQSETSIAGSLSIDEDIAQTYTISLGNTHDDSRNLLIDGKIYIQLSDTASTENAEHGVFTFGDGSALPALTTLANNEVQDENGNSIPAGDYYVITAQTFSDTIDIKYTPFANEYGNDVTITSYAITQEDPDTANSGYDTLTYITTNSITAHVNPVNDGISTTPTMAGDEDGIALLNFGAGALNDSSESINGATLSDVPSNYEVTLNGVVQTGTVTGKDANGNYLYEYSFAGVTSIADLETIGIKRTGVEDFSGTVSGLTLSVNVGESGVESAQSWTFDATFNPVADALLNISATKTFGDEYTWVAINTNTNVKDTDSSESITMILSSATTALDDTALFRLVDANGVVTSIPSGDMSASFNAGTWTLSGIAFDEVNDLQIMYHSYNDTVDVVVKTVDSATGLPTDTLSDADDAEDSFNLNLASSTNITTGDEDNVITTSDDGVTVNAGGGADTITGGTGDDTITTDGLDTIDGGAGFDTIIIEDSITLDFALLDNIEKIDLGTNATNETLNITLDNILNITDVDNEIVITGDTSDDISAIDTNGWTQDAANVDAESNGDGTSTYEYTRDSDSISITLTVDDQIDSTGM